MFLQEHFSALQASYGLFSLDAQRASEAAGGVVGFCAVVIHEDGVEAAITEERAAEVSDPGRCLQPA